MSMPSPKRTRAKRAALEPVPESNQEAKQDPPSSETPKVEPRTPLRRRASENARLLIALALLVAGIVLVLLGWYGAANTNILTEQIPYLISGGLLGLGLIVVAGILVVSASQQREMQALLREVAKVARSAPSASGSASAGTVYVVPGGNAYHVAGCPVIEGKESLRSFEERAAISAGYATCRLCGPE